jgi:hypothetical protein
MINPALTKFPEEAALIGMLVIAYSELDISMVDAAGTVIGLRFPLLDAAEAVNSEMTRIELVKRMSQKHFAHIGLEPQFMHAVSCQDFCREVRNHYAHCHYADFEASTVLAVVKAKDLFSDQSMTVARMPWRHIDKGILLAQESFFENTRAWWLWLAHAAEFLLEGKQPKIHEPPKMERPLKLGEPYTPPT